MIKLFTLEQLSAFSSDAVYKICLTLDAYGFSEEDRQSFEGEDALLTAASFAVEDGDDVILAVENADYLALKEKLLQKLMLEGVAASAIAERIAQSYSDEEPDFDLRAHCTVPQGSVTHLTKDGLFSGFTSAVQNGSLTVMPLDFDRIDDVLSSFVDLLFAPHDDADTPAPAAAQPTLQLDEEAENELLSPVTRMVETLYGSEKHLALALGTATRQILEMQAVLHELYRYLRRRRGGDRSAGDPDRPRDPRSEDRPRRRQRSVRRRGVRHL